MSLPEYLEMVFNAGIFVGFATIVFALAVSGIYFILSPVSVDMRSKAKDWLTGAVSGFLIFILLYLIVTTLNPQLAIFKIGKALGIPEIAPPNKTEKAGVYLYYEKDCKGESSYIIQGDYKFSSTKKVQSVKVISHAASLFSGGDYYVAILYERKNHEGKCQALTAALESSCTNIKVDVLDSLLVEKANFNLFGSGDEVTFYRNPSFTEKGGYLKVRVPSVFEENLKNLHFTGTQESEECNVPKEEQNCILWDKNGNCVERECPSLEGKNIASIKIDGNVVVLLSYFSPEDDNGSIQTFCQTYPSIYDINKEGPTQISWDKINHHYSFPYGFYPNHIRIISIKK